MPRKGSSASRSAQIARAPEGTVTYTWQGERSLADWQAVLETAFEIIQSRATHYWRDEEWTQDRHPYMTGTERDSGFFHVNQTDNLVIELEFGAEAPWAGFEEFGTVFREGHHPIRNTLDRVAYRSTDVIREQARRLFG